MSLSENFQWKSGSLNQEIPVIKLNNRNSLSSGQSFFRAFPPRIYRKELVFNNPVTSCNPTTNLKVSNFETPGGAITTNVKNNISAPLYYTNTTIDETCRNSATGINSIQTNSLRRLRSAGAVKKNYFTSSHQYLNNRNASFSKQQFTILREQNGTDAENVYSTNGLPPSCNQSKKYSYNYFKPNNGQFSVQGAVSNGAYITRRKYDTMQTTAGSFTNLYGNSLAGYGYATKVKYGYPLTCTPTFPTTSNTMVPCNQTTPPSTNAPSTPSLSASYPTPPSISPPQMIVA